MRAPQPCGVTFFDNDELNIFWREPSASPGGERFSVRRRREDDGVPRVRRGRATHFRRKSFIPLRQKIFRQGKTSYPAARDFSSEEGARTTAYRVYVEDEQRTPGKKLHSPRLQMVFRQGKVICRSRRREIFRQKKARGRRRTACTSRTSNALPAEKIRRYLSIRMSSPAKL